MKGPLKILILEDTVQDAEIIKRLLLKEKLNYEFSLAINEKTYLAALDQFQPDIILSDHRLPDINSNEALVIARQRIPGIPFIMVTGTAPEEFAANIIKSGADDYILKDRMARLPAAINAAFLLRQKEREKLEVSEKLKLSEANYRSIMERVSDGMAALDKDWNFTYVNKRAGEIMKRRPAELTGKYIWTEFPDMIGQPLYKACLKAAKKQRHNYIEEYYPALHARLEIHLYPAPDGLSILFRDITERKIAEEKVLQSENNLRIIFENTSEGFLLMDRKGIVKAFNKKAGYYSLFSKEKQIQVGGSIYDAIEEARKESFGDILARVLNGESIHYDRPYDMGGGNTSWIDFSITPVTENGRVMGICVNGRDVTEKKIIEQQKEFDNNNLKALINNTEDLMWSIDRDLKVITYNDAFNKIIEVTSGRSLAKGDDILSLQFSEEQINRYLAFYKRAMSGESFTVTDHFDYPTEFWSEISFYPIRQGDAVIGTACFSRDITERKIAERYLKLLEQNILEQKIQEQKNIARAIIKAQERERNHLGQELHDNVNQILASVKLYLDAAASEDEKLRQLIKYPGELIDNTIDEIRLLCHRLVTPNKDIELEMLLQDLLGKLKQKKVKTTLTYSAGNDLLSDDLKLNIYRIIQEQLNNIVKHAAAKKVNVSVEANAGILHVTVKDDGKGFDINEKRKGIGISNMINRVESFNGKVVIESSPGRGCTIIINVPY